MVTHNDRRGKNPTKTNVPAAARLPINRCNLPAVIHGSLSFQSHPVALLIDGVAELHRDLFTRLDALDTHERRARAFLDYMTVRFRLEALQDAGMHETAGHPRAKANYLRVLRGWLFDPNGREGAVIKGWVESRFGLTPRWHGHAIREFEDEAYQRYMAQRALGLYNTNALEAQLDLLYSYCQYELTRQSDGHAHVRLFRGTNNLDEYEILQRDAKKRAVMLLNNLNSFSASHERACEFGDQLIETDVPLAKIVFYRGLLPMLLGEEDEYMVIGGVYAVEIRSY